jgi:hypothetical protein
VDLVFKKVILRRRKEKKIKKQLFLGSNGPKRFCIEKVG